MKELETRIIDVDVDDIRKKLSKIGTINVKKENQINNIFDFPDRRLLSKKGYARIRVVENLIDNSTHYFMTTKKLLSEETYKIMDEHEIEITSDIEGQAIFEALGLTLIESIKKYRESYKYKDTLIEIDINDKSFCPFPYIEIETADESQLREVVELLGYSMKDTNSKSIYEILKNKGKLEGV
ncbi:MAG: CYTH domain-containing protein [Bacillota bacterium]|nr:CYTH domain-containing protein [Bacillota bacterium]